MISLFKKLSALTICTTAISLLGMKANFAQALTFDFEDILEDSDLDNYSLVGFFELDDTVFRDIMFDEQELERVVIENFTLEGTLFTPTTPLVFDVFTGSDLSFSVFELFGLILDEFNTDVFLDIDGKLLGQTADGTSSFSLLLGDLASNGNGLDFELISPVLAGSPFDGGFSLSLTAEQIEQRDFSSLEPVLTSEPEPEPERKSKTFPERISIPKPVPEPTSILGLVAVGAAGAVSTLKCQQK